MQTTRLQRAWSTAVGVIVAVLAVGQACMGQTIVTNLFDTFTDNGRTNGSDPLDTDWYGVFSAIDLSLPPAVSEGALATRIHDLALGKFNSGSVTLVRPGDYVEVSASVRAKNTVADWNGWVLGLFNSRGTPLTYDIHSSGGDSTPIADDDGYWITKFTNNGVTTSDFRMFQAVNILPNGVRFWEATQLANASSGINATDTAWHTIGLRITLAANMNDVILQGWFDGYTNTYAYVGGATGPVGLTFDQVVIGGSSGSQDLQTLLDNITVTSYLIPPRGTVLSIR